MSGKRGQKPYEPNEKDLGLVRELAADGVTVKDIAFIVGISHPTLLKYYGDEMRRVRIENVRKAGKNLYQQAMKGNMTALIFYLKSQGGWREKQEIDLNVEGGLSVEQELSVPQEVLEALIAKL